MAETKAGEMSFAQHSQHDSVLIELRQAGQLCDATIKVENGQFLVHRAILSACSPYFRAIFTNEKFGPDKRELTVPGVQAETMKPIIDYAYTGDSDINCDNVEVLLPAADQFHMVGLVKKCCDYLKSQLTPDNIIGIKWFAKAYFCTHLAKTAHTYLMYNFVEVAAKSNEYLQLGKDELAEILESDELNVRNEETVFDAILRWIDFDTDARVQWIDRLIRTTRMGLMSTQYFVETVKCHPYIKDNEACKPLIIETLKFLYDLDIGDNKVDMSNPLSRPRIPHEIIFVIGGWSGGSPTNVVETYDTRADRWIVCGAVDSGPRAYHGTVCLDHVIYVIGGFDGMDYFNSCRKFDPVTKVWSEVAPMNARRCYVSVTVLDDRIYAMGGYDGHFRMNTAEVYIPNKNQWSLVQPMNHQRSDASATVLTGEVYVCGGFNGHECLNSSECYNPVTNQWTMIPNMRNRRSGVSITTYRGCVYAIGGFNGISRMNTGEKYNPVSQTWANIPDMYNPRSNFAIEVIDDMIFAIGGFNGVTTIFNVECYDATSNEWYDATDMNVYRSAVSACVVKGLPNVREYAYKTQEREGSPLNTEKRQKTCNETQE